MINERGGKVVAGELIISSRDEYILLQVLQAEIVVRVLTKDVKVDEEAFN